MRVSLKFASGYGKNYTPSHMARRTSFQFYMTIIYLVGSV